MNQSFIKSTLILSIATLVSKILGSIFRIPLQNIAGDQVLGIFSLVYPVYMVALTLSVAGIPIAISQLITKARVNQNQTDIRNIFVTAGILAFLFGVISFSFISIFSRPIAHVLGGQDTRISLLIVASTLLIAPYMAVYRGFYQGFEDMRPTAISQVLEQLVRVGFILVIAYIFVQQHYTNQVIAGGIMIGSPIGALLSLIYLRSKFARDSIKPTSEVKYTYDDFKKIGKQILKISIPICIGAITMALLNFVDSITIPFSLRSFGDSEKEITYLYGIYGRGLSLVQIATVFSSSIVLPLIPLITSKLLNNERVQASNIIGRAHWLTNIVSWPAAFGLLALTLPLNLALFKNTEGSMVLAIINFSSVFTSLTVLGTGILQGMNKAKQAAIIIIIGVLAKVITNIVFVKYFGLTGAGISTLLIYIVIFFINTHLIMKNVSFSLWNRKTLVSIFASIVMGAVVGVPTLYLQITDWGRMSALLYLGGSIVIGGLIYAILLILLKAIDREELSSFPIIGKFFKKAMNQ
ncbi:polysaccharide biosynthesis protein [Heyndrickxia oleronia]|uniref:putative polysaccharide biosynthesis protein n=1 Tax=Heyndrickxia oleronia TaxID=38875 RepID=UPI00203A9BCA|nr:polysaccharide biosynthesis protein [Heyndrickxia oleronia]MCM3238458.1 polysaccharide biosynthesis protein [Heyndrickxia oleronia]